MKLRKGLALLLALIMAFCVVFTACDSKNDDGKGKITTAQKEDKTTQKKTTAASDEGEEKDEKITLDNIPAYTDKAYVVINDNQPEFSESDITNKSYEKYSELDSKGRCGVAIACVGKDLMPAPNEERKSISHVYPSGWKTADDKSNNNQYDAKVVPGGYIYNRCHLIGWQLTAENANKSNLITGTQYFNIEGMVPFENDIADYIKETGNHVMYRVTPIYDGDNLVASGVQLEAYSVEDNGAEICFNVYVYNVQPGIEIDYSTGKNKLADLNSPAQTETTAKTETTGTASSGGNTYVLNKSSKMIHLPSCPSAKKMSEKNREETNKTIDELKAEGCTPCGTCKPS